MVLAGSVDIGDKDVYSNKCVATAVGEDSIYAKYVRDFEEIYSSGLYNHHTTTHHLLALCSGYGKAVNVDEIKASAARRLREINNRYPMLKYVTNAKGNDIEDYIRLIDTQEKTND
jgi:hypothetical protein